MKLTILKAPTKEDWILCKQAAYVTMGKETDTEPSLAWKQKILKSVHSPIRTLNYAVLMEGIPSWVSVHLVRHIHAQPFVSTQRNDRGKRDEDYDRRKAPQDTPVDMIWYFNAEELMTICHKRLCMLASKETREVVQEIVKQITELCPEWKGTNLLVPLCTYRGGICTEFAPCAYYKIYGHGYIAEEDKVIDQGVKVTTELVDMTANFYANVDLMDIPNALEWTRSPGHAMDLYLDNRLIGVLFSYADSITTFNGIQLGFYVDGVESVQKLQERYKRGEFSTHFNVDPSLNRLRMLLYTKGDGR